MKKISAILIIILLMSINCIAQFQSTSSAGSNTTLNEWKGAIRGNLATLITSMPDTATANNGKTNMYNGSLISVGNDLYVRSLEFSQWIKLGGVLANDGVRLVGSTVKFGDNLNAVEGIQTVWEADSGIFRAGYIDNSPRGQYSAGIGYYPIASGFASFAGSGGTASGNQSAAFYGGTASGLRSFATSGNATASAQFSFATGALTFAQGEASFASGSWNEANATFSSVFGYYNKAQSFGGMAIGNYGITTATGSPTTTNNANVLFNVGNGTNEITNRHTAFSILQSGNVGINVGITPAFKLDVNGTINTTAFRMPTGASSGYVLTSDGAGLASWQPGGGGGSSTLQQVTTNGNFTTDSINHIYSDGNRIAGINSTDLFGVGYGHLFAGKSDDATIYTQINSGGINFSTSTGIGGLQMADNPQGTLYLHNDNPLDTIVNFSDLRAFGGAVTLQQAIDYGNQFDKNNTVDVNSFDFTFNNSANFNINTSSGFHVNDNTGSLAILEAYPDGGIFMHGVNGSNNDPSFQIGNDGRYIHYAVFFNGPTLELNSTDSNGVIITMGNNGVSSWPTSERYDGGTYFSRCIYNNATWYTQELYQSGLFNANTANAAGDDFLRRMSIGAEDDIVQISFDNSKLKITTNPDDLTGTDYLAIVRDPVTGILGTAIIPTIYTSDGTITDVSRKINLNGGSFIYDSVGGFSLRSIFGHDMMSMETTGTFFIQGDFNEDGSVIGRTIQTNKTGNTMLSSINASGASYIPRLEIGTNDDIVNVTISNATLLMPNYYTTSSTPSISAGTGAGSSPTVSVSGNNSGGIISITTGSLPSVSSVIATITFSNSFAFPNGCSVIITPHNSNAAVLSGATMVLTQGTTSDWNITSGSAALTTLLTYEWNYKVEGY